MILDFGSYSANVLCWLFDGRGRLPVSAIIFLFEAGAIF